MNLVQLEQFTPTGRVWWSPDFCGVLDIRSADLGQAISLEAGTIIQNWHEARRHYAEPVSRSQTSPEQRFHLLAAHWKKSVKHLSSTTAMAMHPAYQEIIGMGPVVVPYILQELSRELDHWFWALRVITGVDPVPPSSRGRVREMAEAWIRWGRDQGHVGR